MDLEPIVLVFREISIWGTFAGREKSREDVVAQQGQKVLQTDAKWIISRTFCSIRYTYLYGWIIFVMFFKPIVEPDDMVTRLPHLIVFRGFLPCKRVI